MFSLSSYSSPGQMCKHVTMRTNVAQICHPSTNIATETRATKQREQARPMSTVEVALNRFQHCPD